MKKLLLTTAIAGSALLAGNAIAQTTVSGQLDLSFKAISSEKTADGVSSLRGMGKEWQVNIANKGKLNNGMDYAAGFSLEHDGQQTGSTGLDENVYIDFISGNTTLTIGTDHIQQSERTLATFVGLIAEDITNSSGGSIATDIFLSDVGANPVQAYGIGVTQNIPNIGAFSVWYAPNNTGVPATGSTAFVGNDDSVLTSSDESAYELGFTGSLGVKGLNTHAFMNKSDKSDAVASVNDVKGTNIGVSYNTGALTVGYNYKKTEYTALASSTIATGETKQDEFGIAYALSPNLTVAANYTKADPSSTLVDAKMKSVAVGYNLGAIALSAQAAKLENFNGTAGTDADVLYLRASTKF
jgi:hypothetical protein